uniref:Reverse transcriptase domain-containing protein n=1 Tax=Angiostrongylus cantonensis TaxID=6313 RepID=A0A0K0DPT2_ANGCA
MSELQIYTNHHRPRTKKGELLASLLSEITTFSNDVAALELSTVDHNKEKMHGEFISVLEGDLIAYMELIEREEASAREKNLDSQCRFSAVLKRRAMLETVYSEREIEHAKLLVESKDFDTQIEAFTTLCTPSKPAGAPTKMALEWDNMGLKIDGRQLHQLRIADDIVLITPDISQAERMLADFDKACGEIGPRLNLKKTMFMKFRLPHSRSTERSLSVIEPAVARTMLGVSRFTQVRDGIRSSDMRQRSKVNDAGLYAKQSENKKEDSLFSSLSDFTDTEKWSASEKYIASRFPNDIFLKPSPSVGQNESVSAEVSAFDQTVDDQSIWSPAQSCKQRNENDVMDMTTETDLDQSVW